MAHDGTTAPGVADRAELLGRPDRPLPAGTAAGIDGLDLIREIRRRDLPATVIVMTGHASIDSAVEAMKLGAYDYLVKPVDQIRLEFLVEKALEDRKLQDEVRSLRQGLHQRYSYHNLFGKSPRMREVFARVARVSASNCTVLITGETGTGKELVAQAIHYNDATRRGPLVAVNCAAMPGTAAGERVLRPRERGLHRRRPPEEGPVRAGRRRDDPARRDRRAADGDAGQAPPSPPGWDVRAGRRRRDDPGRRPNPRRDQR